MHKVYNLSLHREMNRPETKICDKKNVGPNKVWVKIKSGLTKNNGAKKNWGLG